MSDSSSSSGAPSPTSTPLATPVGAASDSPSDMPAATIPQTQDEYNEGEVIVATGDGLAVRQGPSTQYPQAAAARWSGSETEVLGSPYRLSAGEELTVRLGPLVIDGRAWYSVWHADNEILWTRPGDPDYTVDGWIAANDGTAEFVQLVEPSSDRCCFNAAGVGPTETSEIPDLPVCSGCVPAFILTVGHPDPAGSCDVRVLDHTGAVLFDDTIVGWGNPGAGWSGQPGTKLQIETECAWQLRVGNFAG